MNLVTNSTTAEAIGIGLMLLPDKVRSLAQADFYTEDPVFTGLHDYDESETGRSYRNTAHFCEPGHLRGGGEPTIVIPRPIGSRSRQLLETITTVVHELGHAVWWQLSEKGIDTPHFRPVSWYAETNDHEAFAEGFASVFAPVEVRSRYEHDKDVHGYFAALSLR